MERTELTPINFGAAFKSYREKAGLSQYEVSRRADLSEQTVGNVERRAFSLPQFATQHKLLQLYTPLIPSQPTIHRVPSSEIGESVDLQAALEQQLKRKPDGPSFSQATVKYIQTGLNLAVYKFSQVFQQQFPTEGSIIAKQLHAVLNDTIEPHEGSLYKDESGKVKVKPPKGNSVYANRVVESVYRANPQLGRWDYAICLYPTHNPKFAKLHHPGFNSRFTNVINTGELPVDSPEAEIMAVGYITQIAKIQGVEATRKLVEKAALYSGITGPEYLEQQRINLSSSVVVAKQHQRAIIEGLTTIDQIADKAGFEEPEVSLLLDLAFMKGRAFDSEQEFQKLLRPIVRFVAAGDWEQAFKHRDFLLDYFITAFPQWRQREYQAYMERPSYDSMADVVRAAKKGQLSLSQGEVPDAYKELFGERLEQKMARAEHRERQEIINGSLQLSNAILSGISDSRGNYVILPSPSGTSGRELSRVQKHGNKQVCETYGVTTYWLNFGSVLYTRIYQGIKHDINHPDKNYSDAKRIVATIQKEYANELRINHNLGFSCREYIMAMLQSAKGRLSEADPVVELLEEMDIAVLFPNYL